MATPLSQRVSLGDLQSLRFQGGPLTDGASTLASLTGASSTADGHDEWPNKRRLLASVTRRSVRHLHHSFRSSAEGLVRPHPCSTMLLILANAFTSPPYLRV